VVAAVALDLVRVRVDGEDLVAAAAEAAVDDVAAVALRVPRDAGDRDAPMREELRCCLADLHDSLPVVVSRRTSPVCSAPASAVVPDASAERGGCQAAANMLVRILTGSVAGVRLR
jgi:hypothetical protein